MVIQHLSPPPLGQHTLRLSGEILARDRAKIQPHTHTAMLTMTYTLRWQTYSAL